MTLTRAASAAYAVLVLVLVLAPAMVVRAAGARGGAGVVGTSDLLAVSAVTGAAAAVLAWRRLSAPDGADPASRWIAALGALGVLAAGATAVPTVVLHTAAASTASVLTPGVWGGGLAVAVLAAEAVRGGLVRWLAPVPTSRR
ncbi:hypothetical protein ACI784_22240 [Geodermatophilus sp. SYSU D01186]